ncbi:hypothetical protein [Trichococcus flocculiformis]|uniref:hypothetical protein n=1 Tax=Trichococcus flocculiformis TaxID=82803 RepID=UPI003DA35580
MTNTFMARHFETSDDCYVTYTEISTCPSCKRALAPSPQFGLVHPKEGSELYFSLLDYCSGCKSSILSEYEIIKKPKDVGIGYHENQFQELKFNYSVPSSFAIKEFETGITSLSPQFVKIYNQALQAESQMLDEIAGLGYRKALEFLIKDFSIHKNPDDEEKIQSLLLNQCIKTYINDPNIQILAQKAAWIGNDEAHYLRKHSDRDVSHLKAFIAATVHFISMILIVEDAESMTPK